jgi:hypothetical protein
MQTRYGYFRIPVPTSKRAGVICVRLDCPEKGEPLTYKAALCFCSPKDTFSKRQAHKLLGFRFSSTDARKSNIITLKFDGEKPPRTDFIMREALVKAWTMTRITKQGFERPFIPSWITKRVKSPHNLGEMGMTGGQ